MKKKIFTPSNSKGYTLIEVSLFLAISGVLVLIAVAGLGPRLRNVRFSAAIKGVQESIAKQYTGITSGINPVNTGKSCIKQQAPYQVSLTNGSSASGTNSDCILNGRLIVFREGSMSNYTIASLKDSNPGSAACLSASGFAAILCHGPTVLNSSDSYSQDVNYQNGMTNTSGQLPSAVGYIQDPNSTKIYTFLYKPAASNVKFQDVTGSDPVISDADIETSNASLTTCFALSSRNAKFTFNTNALEPQVRFEAGGC